MAVPRAEHAPQEPGSARALLAGVLGVLMVGELAAVMVVPPLIGYALVSFAMPFTACQMLTDGWAQKQILSLAARLEGRRRAPFHAFPHPRAHWG